MLTKCLLRRQTISVSSTREAKLTSAPLDLCSAGAYGNTLVKQSKKTPKPRTKRRRLCDGKYQACLPSAAASPALLPSPGRCAAGLRGRRTRPALPAGCGGGAVPHGCGALCWGKPAPGRPPAVLSGGDRLPVLLFREQEEPDQFFPLENDS